MKVIYWICWLLVIIGGLNWGLVGLFNFDLVQFLFSALGILPKIIYIVVGIAAVIMIFASSKCHCKVK